MKETEKAYIAGFIDGEGCITVYKSESCIDSKLLIGNTNKEVIEKIRSIVGFGRIYQKKPYQHPLYHKLLYSLEYSSRQAKEVLEEVLPYLIAKHKQAVLFITLVKLKEKSKPNKVFEKEQQEKIFEEIRFLNKKGR